MLGTSSTEFVAGMFRHHLDMLNQAVSTGAKYQEETTRFMNDTFGKTADQFFDHAEKFGHELVPAAKKNFQRAHRTLDDQAKKGMDIVRQSFETTESAFDDGFIDKTMDMWRSSFDTMRTGFETMTKANTQVFDHWVHMAGKCCENTGTKSSSKTANNDK